MEKIEILFRLVFFNKYLNKLIFKAVHEINQYESYNGISKPALKYKNIHTVDWVIGRGCIKVLIEKLNGPELYPISFTLDNIKNMTKYLKDFNHFKIVYQHIQKHYPFFSSLMINDQSFINASSVGNLQIVKFIISERKHRKVELTEYLSNEPISVAIANGHYELVEYLYDQDFTISWSDSICDILKQGTKQFFDFLLTNHYYKYVAKTLKTQQYKDHGHMIMDILKYYVERFENPKIIVMAMAYHQELFTGSPTNLGYKSDLIDFLIAFLKKSPILDVASAFTNVLKSCITEDSFMLFEPIFKEFKANYLILGLGSDQLIRIIPIRKSPERYMSILLKSISNGYTIDFRLPIDLIILQHEYLIASNFHLENYVPPVSNLSEIFSNVKLLDTILSLNIYNASITKYIVTKFTFVCHPEVLIYLLSRTNFLDNKKLSINNIEISKITVDSMIKIIEYLPSIITEKLLVKEGGFVTIDSSLMSLKLSVLRYLHRRYAFNYLDHEGIEKVLSSCQLDLIMFIKEEVHVSWIITQRDLDQALRLKCGLEIIQYLHETSLDKNLILHSTSAITHQNIQLVKYIHSLNVPKSFDKSSIQCAVQNNFITITLFLLKHRTEGPISSVLAKTSRAHPMCKYLESFRNYNRALKLQIE
ncbi:hypothetical protein DLAC_05586 [Tieghemostelium lacteum]|uniref:Ankyrin repeat-containing protein n=1 Tax=Tieghemostelium lacteum TaxID=361077 RepID=A0A151ZG89_TIELA|nr:hypothetical protein DLAC_05586 [Tieghemostelium lacteum]|eukprot:KYQ92983.1 hypothetical protein DLAC_05586 [Tieghemostelium lacteum]